MRRIDEIHLKLPFYGTRRIRDQLHREGYKVNRKKVRRLMRLMGISALYPRRRTSKPGKGHKIYPYLLKDLHAKIGQLTMERDFLSGKLGR